MNSASAQIRLIELHSKMPEIPSCDGPPTIELQSHVRSELEDGRWSTHETWFAAISTGPWTIQHTSRTLPELVQAMESSVDALRRFEGVRS